MQPYEVIDEMDEPDMEVSTYIQLLEKYIFDSQTQLKPTWLKNFFL